MSDWALLAAARLHMSNDFTVGKWCQSFPSLPKGNKLMTYEGQITRQLARHRAWPKQYLSAERSRLVAGGSNCREGQWVSMPASSVNTPSLEFMLRMHT